jgi:hypothetical protein
MDAALKELHGVGVCVGSIAPEHIHFNEKKSVASFARLPNAHLRHSGGGVECDKRQCIGRFDALSPEAVSNAPFTAMESNDVWAVAACIVYHLLGGQSRTSMCSPHTKWC